MPEANNAPFLAQLTRDAISAGQRGDDTYFPVHLGPTLRSSAGVPFTRVLVIPFDGKAPPVWPVGTKVRVKNGPKRDCQYEVCSTPFLLDGGWSFITDEDDHPRLCEHFESIPTTTSVTLRVTGSPEAVEKFWRSDAGVGDSELTIEVIE